MIWETVERPGFYGKHRDQTLAAYDEKYGKVGWRIKWVWGEYLLNWQEACKIYQDAYFMDSFKRHDIWQTLLSIASDVVDHDESDVESGLDYLIQKSDRTHIQDIAVRNVVFHRGWKFHGDRVIAVRKHSEYWGAQFSPGLIPFHLPELIVAPELEGWWNKGSIEAWYQSAKVLQVLGKT